MFHKCVVYIMVIFEQQSITMTFNTDWPWLWLQVLDLWLSSLPSITYCKAVDIYPVLLLHLCPVLYLRQSTYPVPKNHIFKDINLFPPPLSVYFDPCHWPLIEAASLSRSGCPCVRNPSSCSPPTHSPGSSSSDPPGPAHPSPRLRS